MDPAASLLLTYKAKLLLSKIGQKGVRKSNLRHTSIKERKKKKSKLTSKRLGNEYHLQGIHEKFPREAHTNPGHDTFEMCLKLSGTFIGYEIENFY